MATAKQLAKTLLEEIAMDIGKDTVVYVRVMYPGPMSVATSTFSIAIRNHIYNQIMAAFQIGEGGEIIPQFVTTDEKGDVVNRLTERKAWRRQWLAQWRRIREGDGE